MADEAKSMMDIEYVPMYQKRLGEVLTYVRGKMTMAEFAEKCGMNPITFTRIVKGEIKKPLSQEEIRIIAENSDQPTEDAFESLIRANGMVPKDAETPRRMEAKKRRADDRLRQETAQNSLIRSLFERGYTIVPVINTPKEESNPVKQKSRFRFSVSVSFVLSVQDHEPDYWNFRINTFTGESFKNDPDAYSREIRSEITGEFFFTEEVFLRDVWEPEAFENTKYSFVFVNRDMFEGFFKFLEGVKVNNSFSVILADLEKQRVTEERFLPRYDGKVQESLFQSDTDLDK